MASSGGGAVSSGGEKTSVFKDILQKLRKRRIVETLAAFIGGGWLLLEFVHWILVDHYKFPEKSIDLTVVSIIGAILSTLVWRWFRSTEKQPGNVKVEVLLVPLIILATLSIDLTILLWIVGISGKTPLIAAVAACLGISWIVLKSLQWAATGTSLASTSAIVHAEPQVATSSVADKSIIVLPFANISPEEGQEYFCDGMTEEIITDLSQVHDLLVISRSSAMTLKGKKKTIPEIARTVNVRYVLEGSVRKAGNDLRITAQLIDAENDAHIWANKYSGTLDDVFEIQEKVSREIVRALRFKLAPDEENLMMNRPIDNAVAYEHYLKARQGILRFTEEGLKNALKYLQSGIDIVGPNVILYGGMGYTYYQLINVGLETDKSYLAKAEQYANKVFELDPQSPYGHLILGLLKIWWKSAKEGIGHLRKVLSVHPYDFDALYWLSWVYAMIGKKEAAEPLADRLAQIDPLNPAVHVIPAVIKCWDGQFVAALESVKESYRAFPDDFMIRLAYATILIPNHCQEEAWVILNELARDIPGHPLVEFILRFKPAIEGKRSEVLEWKSPELKNWAWRDFSLSYYVAQCCAIVDEKRAALDWLEHSISLGMINYPYIAGHDPFFANIRGEPRFKKLMESVKYEWDHFEE
jgi:non-specific serine/threonine protein kinase